MEPSAGFYLDKIGSPGSGVSATVRQVAIAARRRGRLAAVLGNVLVEACSGLIRLRIRFAS